ncbi:hypothetical protein [Mycobacterium sp. MS1601]|nr:hypothetical protein [Mycobacterium sp. MS1601]
MNQNRKPAESTRVELFLPGGRKFTLTLRGKGFELLKVASAR